MAQHVLLTGGLGFIGYHLARRLLRQEPSCRVTIVDNLSSTRLDYDDLVGRCDIMIADMRELPDDAGPFDVVYHLASPVGSIGILDRMGRIAGDILELASKAARVAAYNHAPLLYVSSSEVYGRDGRHDERSEQVVPSKRGARMEYALGKLTAEHVLFNLATSADFPLRIVRPFNVIGEWQSAALGFVVPRFVAAALTGEPLLVYGTGRQVRSFCHVEDLVDGIIAVQTRGAPGAVYNVGNPHNLVTIGDLAVRIRRLTGASSPIRHVDPTTLFGARYLEAFDKVPDVRRVTAATAWAPGIDLDAALVRIIAHERRRDVTRSPDVGEPMGGLPAAALC